MATILWRAVGALYVLFLLTPLALVVLFAFTDRGIAAFPIDRFSLRWWQAMLADPEFFPALENSLIIGGTVGVVSAVVGTMAAMGLSRLDPRRAQSITALLCL
ncbi:MAG: ABC transporter permease, partial [Dongiaceae bacterium]